MKAVAASWWSDLQVAATSRGFGHVKGEFEPDNSADILETISTTHDDWMKTWDGLDEALAAFEEMAPKGAVFYRDMSLWHQGRMLENQFKCNQKLKGIRF